MNAAGLVIDSTVVMSWCFTTDLTDVAKDVLREVATRGAVTSPLWSYEVASSLTSACRKRRITTTQASTFMAKLEALPIEIERDKTGFDMTLAMALTHGLSAYDASYLMIARHRQLPLATFNWALAEAARSEGVEVMPSSLDFESPFA
ncbi:MAG: type II toxin-antitoxin system VapC family toxin [Propionibacteriaceae bacterium]|nr:type II toxin-antitoxin system VapC family toxin [Propionibacteriaceae bacterium]